MTTYFSLFFFFCLFVSSCGSISLFFFLPLYHRLIVELPQLWEGNGQELFKGVCWLAEVSYVPSFFLLPVFLPFSCFLGVAL